MATDVVTGSIQSRKDYEKTPSGQYKFWETELKSAEKNLGTFRKEGIKIDKRYKGGKKNTEGLSGDGSRSGVFRLNLFHSNTITLQAMMYGNLPKVDVSRRYNDSNDDVGRVAATIMERVLNNDISDNADSYNSILKASLQDRLLPGLGVSRCRYDYDKKTQKEDAPLEYYHWQDVMWGWGRTFSDLPWIGFRSYLEKDEIEARWGKEAADGVQLKKQAVADDKDQVSSGDDGGPWQKAQIWEIWDKKKKRVVWLSPGYDKVLETKDDFLKLTGFYPCPPFLLANQTTSLYTPTSDFSLAQDLYNEIDLLQTRISIITEAVKVVGVYNQGSADISRIFKEGTDNDLIPVDNWALFGESGGIQGQIDWVPMDMIVDTLGKLRELRDENIGLLQQVTGMSDIMRGQLDNQYEGVGQSRDKTKFGSIRIQSLQEEFASFASNLMSIKAEIIGRHYEPQLIAKLANVASFMEPDLQYVPAAIELIKNPAEARLHIIIRPESVAMVDYAAVKAERTEYLGAIGQFMQAVAPIIEFDDTTTPFVLQLLQWGLAGFKGSSEIEGVIDQAIETTQEAAKKKAENPEPTPEEKAAQMAQQAEKMRHENNMAEEQLKHDNNMKEIQAKAQANMQENQADAQADVVKIMADLKADLKVIAAKLNADLTLEAASSQINAEQTQAQQQGEVEKDTIGAALDIEVDTAKANNKMMGDDNDGDD